MRTFHLNEISLLTNLPFREACKLRFFLSVFFIKACAELIQWFELLLTSAISKNAKLMDLAKKILSKKCKLWRCPSVAGLKLHFRDTCVALSWLPCSYRCFALRLVKLSQREKLLPQFVREGGRGMASGGWGLLEYCCMWIQHNSSVYGHICDCVSDEHLSIPVLCQEAPYCFQIECHLCVCVCHASWHTPGWWCVCHTYWGRLWGHRLTGSLGVHCGERKQA